MSLKEIVGARLNLNKYTRSRLSLDIYRTRFSIHDLADKKTALFHIAAEDQSSSIENRTDAANDTFRQDRMEKAAIKNLVANTCKGPYIGLTREL